MTKDEQEQMKKDTYWEIKKAGEEIACLERQLARYMEAMEKVLGAWNNGNLGAVNQSLVIQGESIPQTLPHLPALEDVIKTVQDLERTKEQRDKLQKNFDKM